MSSSKDPNLVRRYWQNKKWNDKKMRLTLSDVYVLLYMARIGPEDIGRDGYHLARFRDKGDYVRGNCRFVHCSVNIGERYTKGCKGRPWTPEQKEAQRQRVMGRKHSAETRTKMSASHRARHGHGI